MSLSFLSSKLCISENKFHIRKGGGTKDAATPEAV